MLISFLQEAGDTHEDQAPGTGVVTSEISTAASTSSDESNNEVMKEELVEAVIDEVENGEDVEIHS